MENEKFQELVLQQLQSLAEGQKELRTDITKIGSRMDRLEIRMENEIIDKLKALFDDREVQDSRFDRIENKL